MKRRLHTITAILALGISSIASASTVTVGDLSYDGSTDLITNVVTNQQYYGLGNLAHLTYAETLILVDTPGYAYADFHIANQSEAYAFYNALSASTVTDTPGVQTHKGVARPGWFDGALGNNYHTSLTHCCAPSDIAFFLSDQAGRAGLVQVVAKGDMVLNESAYTITQTNIFSDSGSNPPISWLLVRDTPAVSAVPIPGAAFMFAPAVLGFLGLRRRAKQA